jgi:soluble P-type ATPase
MDKGRIVEALGAEETMVVGNGYIDRFMLEKAALGFCIIGHEGASVKAIVNSDVILNNIEDFFSMMDEPKRLIATLRG